MTAVTIEWTNQIRCVLKPLIWGSLWARTCGDISYHHRCMKRLSLETLHDDSTGSCRLCSVLLLQENPTENQLWWDLYGRSQIMLYTDTYDFYPVNLWSVRQTRTLFATDCTPIKVLIACVTDQNSNERRCRNHQPMMVWREFAKLKA